MKKYAWINVLLLVSTIIAVYIAFTDVKNSFALPFLIVYVIALLLWYSFWVITVIMKLIYIEGKEIRKRVYKFLLTFTLYSGILFIFTTVFHLKEFTLYSLSTPLGIALGMAFWDVPFLKKKE